MTGFDPDKQSKVSDAFNEIRRDESARSRLLAERITKAANDLGVRAVDFADAIRGLELFDPKPVYDHAFSARRFVNTTRLQGTARDRCLENTPGSALRVGQLFLHTACLEVAGQAEPALTLAETIPLRPEYLPDQSTGTEG